MARKGRAKDKASGDLATRSGKNNLAFYLISRFIVVLLLVMLAESAVVWLESVTFIPLLQALAATNSPQSYETTSVISLIQWTISLIQAMSQADYAQVGSLVSQSVAVGLFIAMLLLLATPVVVGALVFARMVTRKVRGLQEQRERELAQIEQQRNQFITDVAHDLRTPVMAISGMAHALSDGLVRDEAMRDEYLQSICDKSDKMGDLVSSVTSRSCCSTRRPWPTPTSRMRACTSRCTCPKTVASSMLTSYSSRASSRTSSPTPSSTTAPAPKSRLSSYAKPASPTS